MCFGKAFFHAEDVVVVGSQPWCPLPPPSLHVTQLKAMGGRRCIAHCPPALWSFWMASSDPDDKLGGKRIPASASGPLAAGQALSSQLGLSPDVSHTSVCESRPTSARKCSHKDISGQKNWRVFCCTLSGECFIRCLKEVYLKASSKPCLRKIKVICSSLGVPNKSHCS